MWETITRQFLTEASISVPLSDTDTRTGTGTTQKRRTGPWRHSYVPAKITISGREEARKKGRKITSEDLEANAKQDVSMELLPPPPYVNSALIPLLTPYLAVSLCGCVRDWGHVSAAEQI